MIDDTPETSASAEKFDFSIFSEDTLIHERRLGSDRRGKREPAREDDSPAPRVTKERRARKERRRRIDPTTFEKQYTEDEMEFMNAMQRFKELSGKTFPTFRDVLKVAVALGYRRAVLDIEQSSDEIEIEDPVIILAPLVDR
jgi:hypothetical protein